ncbi:MAG TPA: hypothetical protein V6D09_21450 [Leptolyngbyaceae cyanobacterium]
MNNKEFCTTTHAGLRSKFIHQIGATENVSGKVYDVVNAKVKLELVYISTPSQ